MAYSVTLKNPKTGESKTQLVAASTTGEAIARLGALPKGFGIDSVRPTKESPTQSESSRSTEEWQPEEIIPVSEEEDPVSDVPGYQEDPYGPVVDDGRERAGRKFGISALVGAWITGVIVGAGAIWLPSRGTSYRSTVPENTVAPQGTIASSDNANRAVNEKAKDTGTEETFSTVIPKTHTRYSGTSGQESFGHVPTVLFKVTSRDPITRFLYEAVVPADTVEEARRQYSEWSNFEIIDVHRIATINVTFDDTEQRDQ